VTDDVGELAGGEKKRTAPNLHTIWIVVGSALSWSLVLVVVGVAISKPLNVMTNAQGSIISTGGESLLVPYGILSLGISILVTQITARHAASRLMPIALVFSAGLAVTSLLAIGKVGPALVPSAVACVVACVLARRRALVEE
jgi:hypothetical protein